MKSTHTALLAAVLLAGTAMSSCDAAPAKPLPAKPAAAAPAATSASVPMKKDGGVYVVPVSVNGFVTIDCIVDSGASDVNIPADAFKKLVKAGLVRESDYLGTSEYTLADGSTERGRTFRIKSLKVGNVVVNDVVASVGGDNSSALLGQSFLERFKSWSLDNAHHALVLNGPPLPAVIRTAAGPHVPVHPPGSAPDAGSVAQTPSGGHTTRGGDSSSGDTDDGESLVAQHSQ